ncbi:hypothetical protein WJX72_008446 [[Myrmecia] bisecta]|uniref:Ankyrin repeat protein n=1 Tax=[Myrmecia] bisecta TaxID=41462 RepID=A0AAW1PAI6_9CHLO
MLLRSGAKPTWRASRALRHAAEYNHLPILRLLIARGASATTNHSEALQSACIHGNLDMIKLLLESGCDVLANDGRAVVFACEHGHSDAVKLLLPVLQMRTAAHPRRHSDIEEFMQDSLFAAVRGGHLEVLKMLLQALQRIGLADHSLRMALWRASKRGQLDAVRVLLASGHAAITENISEVLPDAICEGHLTVVQALLDAGADPNSDWTPLCCAIDVCKAGQIEMAATTARVKFVPGEYSQSYSLSQPLAWASLYGRKETVEQLLAMGVTADEYAVAWATARGHADIVELLLPSLQLPRRFT